LSGTFLLGLTVLDILRSVIIHRPLFYYQSNIFSPGFHPGVFVLTGFHPGVFVIIGFHPGEGLFTGFTRGQVFHPGGYVFLGFTQGILFLGFYPGA